MRENMKPMQENKMGVMPVGRLLLTMSLPIILSMLVQALYNVVDSIFVSKISEDALTAVSMAFPFQNLMISVAVGTGVGINALLSRSLGEKNFAQANKAAGNGILLALLSAVVFMVAGTLAAEPFFRAQDAATEEIVKMGATYISICSVLCVGVFVSVTFERLLQATGNTVYTLFTQGIGAVINIIFDPLLIFGLGPFPEMGVAGAAVATVLGQIVGAALGVFFHLRVNKELHVTPADLKPDGHIIGRIYAVGVPSIIMGSIGSFMTFAMNKILNTFTSTAVAVFGVYFKVQSFIFMPVFGLNNGMVPIVSYNYGARNKKRLVDTVKLAMVFGVAIMLVGLLVMQFFAEPILTLFETEQAALGAGGQAALITIGVPALRTISYSFIFAGFCVVAGSVFQALGHGVMSMMVSIIRQLVVLVPVAWLLSLSGNLELVWWAFPIAECFSVVLSTIFLVHIYRKVIKPLGETEKQAGTT